MNSAPDNRVKGPRVLVVEDHPAVAQALTSALSDMGAEVMGPVASPEDAQRLTRAKSPDLALVDLHLANEEASELVQWLLKRKLAVIAMSGHPTPPRQLSKAAAYLQKPFTGDELFEAVLQHYGPLREREP